MTRTNSQDFQITAKQFTKMLGGKMVRITDIGQKRSPEVAVGVCRQVLAYDGVESVDIELVNGQKFGMVPDTRGDTFAEGTQASWLTGRRRVELIQTPYSDRGIFGLTAGPSREELFDGLRLRHENRNVPFTADELLKFDVRVNSIGIEDGSGHNWLLKLYDPKGTLGAEYLEGYFNTKDRRGWIRPAQR